MLQGYSVSLAEAVAEGRCAIVGLEYALVDGRVRIAEVVGDIGEA
jgi:carbonic anhydrase